MFSASSYQPIYLTVVTILTIIMSVRYGKYTNERLSQRPNNHSAGTFIIALLFIIFIGFRPMSGTYFVDMYSYWEVYVFQDYSNLRQTENFIFDNIFNWLGANKFDIRIFFVFVSAVYFGCAYLAVKKFFPRDALYGYIVFLAAFSTYSYATNGIKAGAAALIFLCAMAYHQHKWLKWILLFATLGFHHSMIVPITAYVICTFVKKPKYYLYFWIFSLTIALLHISYFQFLFAGMADESGANYLMNTGNWGGKTGFRYDFVLYSALPVAIGWWAIFKHKVSSPTYNFIYGVYLLTNAVWMLCMYASFTNRIAYLSWLMYPVVLIYPFLTIKFIPNQYKRFNQIVWIQLSFTLFMNLVYYG